MTVAARAWLIGATLAGALACADLQAQGPVTERGAANYIYGGFLHDAVHAILARDVKLGPELRQRLALPPDADSRFIYDTLVALTDKKPLVVRKASADELSRYGRSDLRQPLFALEVGETILLIQYDLQANNIPFIGHLSGPLEPVAVKPAPPPAVAPEPPKPVALPPEPPKAVALPPEPPKPVIAPAPPKPVAAKPKPPAVVAPPAPKPRAPAPPPPAPRFEPIQPNGPCVVKPVMSNQDLVNCGATPR